LIKRWVVSDTHFFHSNIIKCFSRPFASYADMNEALIKNWNDRVSREDTVYHLGDFAFHDTGRSEVQSVFERLHGKKILIVGNHDSSHIKKLGWESVRDYYELTQDGARYVMFHYPIEGWNRMRHGAVHYHGHTHNTPTAAIPNRVNVSVEMIDYAPIILGTGINKTTDVASEGDHAV
jgi:calcineurin-like phosphoesterase family protein